MEIYSYFFIDLATKIAQGFNIQAKILNKWRILLRKTVQNLGVHVHYFYLETNIQHFPQTKENCAGTCFPASPLLESLTRCSRRCSTNTFVIN